MFRTILVNERTIDSYKIKMGKEKVKYEDWMGDDSDNANEAFSGALVKSHAAVQLEKTYGGDDRFKITGGEFSYKVDLKKADKASIKFDLTKMERDNMEQKK